MTKVYVEKTEKACKQCKKMKLLSEYHVNRRVKDGRKSVCATCTRINNANKDPDTTLIKQLEALGFSSVRDLEIHVERVRQESMIPAIYSKHK